MKNLLGRRAVLKGALGTVIGLPLLECMLRSDGEALADGSPLPCRYLAFQCPSSLVTSSSDPHEGLTPLRAGFGYDVRPVLSPLMERGVAGDVSVVSGLFVPPLNAPGGYNVDFHGQATFAIMSGVRSGFFGEEWLPQGLSADQIVARTLGVSTLHPSLYFQIDPDPGGDAGVSYEAQGSAFQGVEPEISPSLAYRRLVSGIMPSEPPSVDPAADLERRLRMSSLSYARDQIRGLQGRLGSADRRTLDEHLTRLRELEVRLTASIPMGRGAGCGDPGHDSTDPTEIAPGIPDQERRARLFVELIEMAFACDLTRVATLGGASRLTGAGMRHERWRDVGGLHSDVQHEGTQAELDAANTWFVDVYADLVARLKASSTGAGTLLDQTAAVFVMEGGKGLADDPQRSGDGGSDPNHSVDNAVMMLAGRAGGLRAGQHIDLRGRDLHHAVVFNAAMRAVGVRETLGEIDQTLDALFEG